MKDQDHRDFSPDNFMKNKPATIVQQNDEKLDSDQDLQIYESLKEVIDKGQKREVQKMPETKQKSFKEASFNPLKNKVKIKEEKTIKQPSEKKSLKESPK